MLNACTEDRPLVVLAHSAKDAADTLSISTLHISLSHDNDYAVALAVAES